MSKPAVSVLIPCYNAAAYLEQTIRSALTQLPNDQAEILLWDDGSTDDSVEIAKRFKPAIRVLGDGINRGGNVARNHLLDAAKGEWLQYLDADDCLLSGKIETQMIAAIDLNADLVYAPPLAVTNATVNDKLAHYVDANRVPEVATTTDVWVDFIRWGQFQTSSVLFRRSAVMDVGQWKADQPRCQEHELLLRMLVAGKRFVRIHNQQTLYRVVEGVSVSRRHADATITMRMELTDRAEQHLQASGQMNRERSAAIAAARMESARSLYQYNPGQASQLAARVGRASVWQCAASDALPRSYRLLAATIGFSFAEWFAERFR